MNRRAFMKSLTSLVLLAPVAGTMAADRVLALIEEDPPTLLLETPERHALPDDETPIPIQNHDWLVLTVKRDGFLEGLCFAQPTRLYLEPGAKVMECEFSDQVRLFWTGDMEKFRMEGEDGDHEAEMQRCVFAKKPQHFGAVRFNWCKLGPSKAVVEVVNPYDSGVI